MPVGPPGACGVRTQMFAVVAAASAGAPQPTVVAGGAVVVGGAVAVGGTVVVGAQKSVKGETLPGPFLCVHLHHTPSQPQSVQC